MGESTEEPMLRFWSSFWPVWRVTTFWSTAITALLLSVMGLALNLPLSGFELLIAAVAAALCGVLCAVVVIISPVYVTRDGLRCYDFFGNYQLARWEAIQGGKPANMLGLRYLQVEAEGLSRPRWLPLFLTDMDGFMEAVFRLTSENHPLIRALERSRG